MENIDHRTVAKGRKIKILLVYLWHSICRFWPKSHPSLSPGASVLNGKVIAGS